jgi:hypothetical protein
MNRKIGALLVLSALLLAVSPSTAPGRAASAPTGCNPRAASYFAKHALLPFAHRQYPRYYSNVDDRAWFRDPMICRDLTRDGHVEMIVGLHCCTGGSLSPWAIFKHDRSGQWRRAYARVRDTVFQLRVRHRVVRTTIPAPYEGACTRHVRYRLTRWNGRRFRTHTTGRRPIGHPC